METQRLWLQEAARDKRIGLSKLHGPANPADLRTKHVDHSTQIRLLALMSVEARVGRAETAPETGEVDEQVCSGESATEEVKEHECERQNNDEEAIEWVHECMDGWGDEFITGPFGAGDAQPKPKCAKKEEIYLIRNLKMSSCQTRYNETETESSSGGSITEEQSTEKEEIKQKYINAARCSVEVSTRMLEMNDMDLDTARRSVETIEGDPVRYALVSDTRQRSALAPERVSPVCQPNIVSANRFRTVFCALGQACIESAPPCHRGPNDRQRGVANSRRALHEAEGTHRSAGDVAERAVCS